VLVTRSNSKETERSLTAILGKFCAPSSRFVFERVGGRQGSERFAQLPE
jgi:hypothetical protein